MTEYFTELTQGEAREYLRGNLFTNTPDILPPILQQGGGLPSRCAWPWRQRFPRFTAYTAATNLARTQPSRVDEEYLHSEKYELKVWDWNRPGNIKDFITTINRIRAGEPGLALLREPAFLSGG